MKKQRTADVVGFRASEADRAKLEKLARQTDRTVSDVLRRLVRLAEPAGVPDLRLSETTSEADD